MKVFINRSNHWISYHLIDEFLLANCTVHTLTDKEKTKTNALSMFFARNSLYTELENPQDLTTYDIALILDDEALCKNISAKRKLLLTKRNIPFIKKTTTIYLPLLFGEWMKMDEKGLFLKNKHILFTSNLFKKEALYIKIFAKVLINLLQKGNLPKEIYILSRNSTQSKQIPTQKCIHLLKDERERYLPEVIAHYQQHKLFYP